MKIYRLKESKTNQLKKLLKNGNITEEQFNVADEFFKKHSVFENEIDWNRGLSITWDDLKAVIYRERNSESKTKKRIRKGLEGFEEGKDYLVLEETDSYTAYQPFTWEASRMIASHYVEPSRNGYGNPDDADWCTAYQKNSSYWDNHNKKEAFIYICGETIPSKKVAISISKEEKDASDSEFLYSTGPLNYNIWDFYDYNDTIEEEELLEVVPDLYDLIIKAYSNWEDKYKESIISKFTLNPQTNRYDYDGDLDKEVLNNFVSEDRNGFTLNFGIITGNFNCYDLGLTSLEGAPQEVGGSFNCSWNKLSSLEGAPKTVGGNFNCYYNQLTSLKGAPKEVGGWFDCHNNRLSSLKGAPTEVGGSFDCHNNRLSSLKGAPKKVDWNFICSYNQLTSLKEAPQEVGGYFDCENNFHLHSLDGIGEVRGTIYKDF